MSGFLQSLAERGAASALEDAQSGLVLSYADLAQRIGGAQVFLTDRNIGPGDRILSRLPSTTDTLVLMLACVTLGADYAPLSMHASSEEARQFLSLVRPKLVVQPTLGNDPTAEILALENASVRIACGCDLAWAGSTTESQGVAEGGLITSTSGTSDSAKALRIDLRALIACARAFVSAYPTLQDGARYLHTAPAWSLSGMFNLCLVPLATGGCVVTGASPSTVHPGKMLHDAARLNADVLWLAPTLLRAVLADAPLSDRAPQPRLRCVLTGMSPISPEEKEEAQAKLGAPVFENYGLAETLLLTAAHSTKSSGGPLPGVRLRVADGEIIAHSPFVADGYLTEDGGLAPLNIDETGGIRTGDLGHIAASGELAITGRMKAVVKRAGGPVLLPVVETAARRAAGVVEAVAVSAQASDEERYVLFVTGLAGADRISLVQAVRLALAKSIDRDAWPDQILALETLPLLSNGKPDAPALRRGLGAHPESSV